MRNLFFSLALLTSLHSEAQVSQAQAWESLDGGMPQVADRLSRAPQRSLYNANSWAKDRPSEFKGCRKQYDQFFADGVLRINLALGYHDWPETNKTLDQQAFGWIQSTLTRPCPSINDTLCGFTRADSPFLSKIIFLKKMASYTNGSPLQIRIEMAYSSYSSFDSENFSFSKISQEQIATSKLAEELFFDSIAGQNQTPCEVCAYMGHSRNGGGPDFRPVPLEWANSQREPNYEHYLKTKNNYRRLLRALNERPGDDSALVAIMGCNSYKKFYTESSAVCLESGKSCSPVSLKSFENRYGYVLTRALSWPTNRPAYLATFLEGLTSLKCSSSYAKNLKNESSFGLHPEAYELFGGFLK